METTTVSSTSSFLDKLTKSQVLVTLATLVVFFVTLNFTSNKDTAFWVTLAAIGVILVSFTFAYVFSNVFVVFDIPLAFLFALFDTLVAAEATNTHSAISSPVGTVFLLVILAITIAVLMTREARKNGIRKRLIWLSFMVQFFCISPLMLLARTS